MNTKKVIYFLLEIKNVWSRSDNKEAEKRAEKLSSVLENGTPILDKWDSKLSSYPPPINFTKTNTSSQGSAHCNKEMYDALIDAFDSMPWKYPRQLSNSLTNLLGGEEIFKSAMLLKSLKTGCNVCLCGAILWII